MRPLLLVLLLTGCASYPQPGKVTAIGYDSPRLVVREGATYDGTGRRLSPSERDAAYAAEFDVGQLDAAEARRLRWMAAGMAFDIASTERGLARGCVELNPLGQHPAARVALKAPALIGYYQDAKASPLSNSTGKRRAWWAAGLNFGAGVHNLATCG
jgi:hypothetical protein